MQSSFDGFAGAEFSCILQFIQVYIVVVESVTRCFACTGPECGQLKSCTITLLHGMVLLRDVEVGCKPSVTVDV